MHSYFPHPLDWLIILRISGFPDAVDRYAVRYLLKNRLSAHDRISILLQFDPPDPSVTAWSQALFDEQTSHAIERIALVIEAEETIADDLKHTLVLAEVRRFDPDEGEVALRWIQSGAMS